MISGNNGILTKATDAKKANVQGVEEDRMQLAIQSALIDGEGTIDLTKHTGNNAPVGLEKALKDEFGEGANSPYTTYVEGRVTLSSGKKFNVTTSGSVKEAITFARTSLGTLAVGSEVTASNGEQFYIIGGDIVGTEISGSTENVILLAKYNLGSNGKQDTTGYYNPCVFCSSTAWEGASVSNFSDNLNNKTTIKSETTSAVSKAIAYGESLGAIEGRLMLNAEAEGLRTSYSAIVYGQYGEGKYLKYWLGSPTDVHSWCGVSTVDGNFINMDSSIGSLNEELYFDSNSYGVRPVIEVSSSSIE